jgi:hypothetical protein
LVNPVPGPFVLELTILPPTNTSAALMVVIVPEELVVPFPPAPLPTSKGLDVSSPLYSSTLMSGKAADPPKVTVTVFEPPAMFLA